MKKTAIIYGSTTGVTESVAAKIAAKLGISQADIYEASVITPDTIKNYDNLLLGSSTWGDGELQDDWYSTLEMLVNCDLSTKNIAIFGCGDSVSYCDTFCDAIGIIYEAIQDKCNIVGAFPTEGYEFDKSKAVIDGKFVGLPIDENNEDYKTEERINAWTNIIKAELP